jgi:hypothetical protein
MGNGNFSKSGMFFVGFFVGILVAALVLIGAARYVIQNPRKFLGKAADLGVSRIIEKTMASAPKQYIGQKQEDIAATAQVFANAYSQNRIKPEDLQALGGKVVSIMADQKITPEEIDEVLQMMKRVAGGGGQIPTDSSDSSGVIPR